MPRLDAWENAFVIHSMNILFPVILRTVLSQKKQRYLQYENKAQAKVQFGESLGPGIRPFT